MTPPEAPGDSGPPGTPGTSGPPDDSDINEEGRTTAERHGIAPDVPDLPKVSFNVPFELHPVVFPVGAAVVMVLVLLTFAIPPDRSTAIFGGAQKWIGSSFGWLYILSLTGLLLYAIVLAAGRFGKVKLGKDDEPPEFGRLTWFAMLFSAGMGIGLVFWSVAEPIYHFNRANPLPGFENEQDARAAMAVTIFHWGLHPWALYAIVALALAYFGFRMDMPLSFRSLLHPIFGDLVWGRLGDAVGVLAIVATLTGVATSLGIGAQQVNAGLAFLFGLQINETTQVLLIAGITAVATISVVLGLDVGIRRLSEANMILAAALMIIVLVGGGVVAFFSDALLNTVAYVKTLPFSSVRTGLFGDESTRSWLNGWTVFYWAWWIAWSPFVGMFIARVSRGRTIREFIVGVLLVPTAVGIVWLTAFGNTTLRQHEAHVAFQNQAEAPSDREARGAPRDEGLPEYPVQKLTDDGAFALAEDGGTLVGIKNGGVYRRTETGYVALAENTPVVVKDGSIVSAETGEDYAPPPYARFVGPFAADVRPLTAVEYLSAPVLNESRTERLDTLPTALFALLDGLFGSGILITLAAGAATLCIILFFVTSSDSASMVIDIIASGGNPDPPVGTRLFWAITEGVVAAALLLAGGLKALQAASITAALPFTVILLLACIGLYRALHKYEKPPFH